LFQTRPGPRSRELQRPLQGTGRPLALCIDPDLVVAEIRYENLEGAASLFPHIYGPLNLDAVINVLKFIRDDNGVFIMPVKILG